MDRFGTVSYTHLDVYKRQKLHIENRKRVVYVIDTGKNSNEIAVELVKNLADIRKMCIRDRRMILIHISSVRRLWRRKINHRILLMP